MSWLVLMGREGDAANGALEVGGGGAQDRDGEVFFSVLGMVTVGIFRVGNTDAELAAVYIYFQATQSCPTCQ